MEKSTKYRAYYRSICPNINFDGYWYSDPYSSIDYARDFLKGRSEEKGFIEGHIKEEITTKRIIERITN